MVTTKILIGGGEIYAQDAEIAQKIRGEVICADGGSAHADAMGLSVGAIVGDLDSYDPKSKDGAEIFPVEDQDRTDFQKALAHIGDDFAYCFGFWGKRLDHSLAALSAIAEHHAGRALLFTEEDICFLAPSSITLDLKAGDAIAFYPLSESTASSEGLAYPLDDLSLSPTDRISSSNRALGPVTVSNVTGHLLVILPKAKLSVIDAALL